MTSYYRVELTVGEHSWTVRQGDPAAYGPIDGLSVEWAVPDNESFPWQPVPVEAKFGLVVEEAGDVSIDIGSRVSIAVFTEDDAVAGYPEDYPPPLCLYAGRIADLEAVPHRLGTIYTIKCVDYLSDLIALSCKDIGAGPEVAFVFEASYENHIRTNVRGYMDALAAEAGIPSLWPSIEDPDPAEDFWGLQSLGLGLDSVFTHMCRVLLSYINLDETYTIGTAGGRGVIVPNVVWDTDTWTAALDPERPFEVQFVTRETPTGLPWTMLPGEFQYDLDAAHWTVVVDPESDDVPLDVDTPWTPPIDPSNFGIIPAGLVELKSVRWIRNKSQSVDTTELGWREPQMQDGSGFGIVGGGRQHTYRHSNTFDPIPVVRTLGELHMWNGSLAGNRGQVPYVARFYLSEAGTDRRYQADKFVIHPAGNGADPHRITRLGLRNPWTPIDVLGSPIVAIAGVPERWNPNPGALDWYAGAIRAAKLTIDSGDYTVETVLDQNVPRADSSDVDPSSFLRWADMVADEVLAEILWGDIDPRVTWQDLRIVRRTPVDTPPPEPDDLDDLILAIESLEGFWRHADANGSSVLFDSSPHARHGVRVGTPTAVPSLITGYTDTSTDLDPGDYGNLPYAAWMLLPDAAAGLGGGWTVWGLIKPTKVATPGAIFARHASSAMAWDIQFSGGKLQFRGRPAGGGGNIQILNSVQSIAADRRFTFACTHNNVTGVSSIYIDGVLDASTNRSLDYGGAAGVGIGIGSLSGGYAAQWYDGVIGPIALCTTVFSPTFIATLHDAANGIAPPP